MFSKLRIYMAHPNILHNENVELQKFLLDNLDVEIIDPMEHPYSKTWNCGDTSQEMAIKIVQKDLAQILSCDIVVAFYPEYTGSIATSIEIWFASHKDKPVFVLTQHEVHPWLMYANTITVRNKLQLLQAIKSMLPWRE